MSERWMEEIAPVAWQWRSRIKGGPWDAWENGRFGQQSPPFMEVEERALYPATALSAAHEAGRREEREACAMVADSERAVWGGDFSIVAFSARKAAEDIATAIRSREDKS